MDAAREKICSKCKIVKPLTDFGPHKKTPDGRHSWCRACKYEQIKAWRAANPGIAMKIWRRYRDKDPGKYREMRRAWADANRDKTRRHSLKYTRKIRQTIPGRLSSNISNAIRTSLRGEKHGCHWESMVGFTLRELKIRLERQFLPGMSWDNRDEWDIDHIIPISAFNFRSMKDIDFRRCWNVRNLRPLWKSENLSKGAKLSSPFQPSLAIAI
jgi:hypothetical protein